MQGFHINGDKKRLYFRNDGHLSDEEEYARVMTVLRHENTVIGETKVMPYCDIIGCTLDGTGFDVVCHIDGDGTFIYCEDEQCMGRLEELFR